MSSAACRTGTSAPIVVTGWVIHSLTGTGSGHCGSGRLTNRFRCAIVRLLFIESATGDLRGPHRSLELPLVSHEGVAITHLIARGVP